jgi:hypothetical protein
MGPKPGKGPILIKLGPTVMLTSEHSGQMEKKVGRKTQIYHGGVLQAHEKAGIFRWGMQIMIFW